MPVRKQGGECDQLPGYNNDEIISDVAYRPTRKHTEAHRALELLEDYHAKLTRPQDKQLRLAIERVIRIFKSRLFQALLGKTYKSLFLHESGTQFSRIQVFLRLPVGKQKNAPSNSPNLTIPRENNTIYFKKVVAVTGFAFTPAKCTYAAVFYLLKIK
ncbi:uncharacterized protein LOC144477159 [Augochlora pura]